mmetsp:Transcript_21920/g.39985  ORF Transcript_21920/g.39985 Transcript_21920/m.39985 type:complete len:208 (-) Transcript_21920:216-839(-)
MHSALNRKVHFIEYKPSVPPQDPCKFLRTPPPRKSPMSRDKKTPSPASLGIAPLYISDSKTPVAGVQNSNLIRSALPFAKILLKGRESGASARESHTKCSVSRIDLRIEKPLYQYKEWPLEKPKKKPLKRRNRSKDWQKFTPITVREVIFHTGRDTPSLIQLPPVKPTLRTPSLRNSVTEAELSPSMALSPRYFSAKKGIETSRKRK